MFDIFVEGLIILSFIIMIIGIFLVIYLYPPVIIISIFFILLSIVIGFIHNKLK